MTRPTIGLPPLDETSKPTASRHKNRRQTGYPARNGVLLRLAPSQVAFPLIQGSFHIRCIKVMDILLATEVMERLHNVVGKCPEALLFVVNMHVVQRIKRLPHRDSDANRPRE